MSIGQRPQLGRRWRDVPLLVRILLLPRAEPIMACDVCGATWHRSEGFPDDCKWCAARARADADYILRPPAEVGYGYATRSADHPEWTGEPFDDFKALGIDPDAERKADLARWAQDLELAVGAGLVTEQEARVAWASQKN